VTHDMHDMDGTVDRRTFLKGCACALGGSLVWGGPTTDLLGRISVAQAALGPGSAFNDYRALVCVFLGGGNDAFNTIVPRGNTEYTEYATARQNLSVPQSSLLPINANTPDGRVYGFNADCQELQFLYNNSNLAVLANVGVLTQPTTRAEFQARSVPLPPQLFSHSDQTNHWHTSRPDAGTDRTGWAGRMADLLAGVNGSSTVSPNISLSGVNVLQTGQQALPYAIGTGGITQHSGLNTDNTRNERRLLAFRQLLDQTQQHVLAREFANVQRRAMDNAEVISAALDAVTLNTTFPTSSVGRRLEAIARFIAIRTTLGVTRQVFYVSMGGFDTHGEQATRHPALLSDLSASLSAFYSAMVELQIQDNVTSFTASDFGRTLTSNGDGTDHGWGGHHMILGGCVNGGEIYGTMPAFEIDGPDDSRGGRLIPTTSVDEYAATLCRWFGLSDSQLATVFPNLSRFATPNLGFMM
jgi:uncharacterized protein (DUF1501 family)